MQERCTLQVHEESNQAFVRVWHPNSPQQGIVVSPSMISIALDSVLTTSPRMPGRSSSASWQTRQSQTSLVFHNAGALVAANNVRQVLQ